MSIRPMWVRAAVWGTLLATCPAVVADMETDRRVGICTMYLIARQNAGAETAINLADNQDRAVFYGQQWAQQMQKHKKDKVRTDSLIYDASAACRKIGIRPGDFE